MQPNRNRRFLSPGRVAFDEIRRIGKFDRGAINATLDYVIPRLNDPLPDFKGFGVVTVGGGRYLKYVWAMVRVLRTLSDCPVQCYYLGPEEIDHPAVNLLRDLGVEFVDAVPLMGRENYQSYHGWCAKSVAVKNSPFETVCFMDADCIPLVDPEGLQAHRDFSTGFLCFPDIQHCRTTDMLFPEMGLRYIPNWVEAEAGQFLVSKNRFWKEIQLYSWMNGRPKPFHELAFGDKAVLQLACMKLEKEFQMAGKAEWLGDAIRHFLTDGTAAFLHCGEEKRSGSRRPEVADLLREFEALQ